MDLENGLLHAVLEDPDLLQRLEILQVESADLDKSDYKRAFKFIVDYNREHHALPTVEAVNDLCHIELKEQGVEGGFLVSELLKRKLFRVLNTSLEGVQAQLRENKPEEAYDRLRQLVETTVGHPRDVHPRTIFDQGQDVIDLYEKVKRGYTGIPLPWQTLTDATMGMWPKTSTYFAARPAVGKTWVAMLAARHAWQQDYRVLIVSPEMSAMEIAERFFVVEASVSGNNALRGTLSEYEFVKLKDSVKAMKGCDGLWIMDAEDDLTPFGLESAIRNCKPQLVAIDSIYMLDFSGDRMERTVKAVDWMRYAAKRYSIATLGFHMLSRAAVKSKKGGGVGYEDAAIALTDQLFWDAQAVFLMEQDGDMRADKRMKIHTRKIRRGIWTGNKPLEVFWDFDRMKFSEIDSPREEFRDRDYKPDDNIPF